MEPGRSKKFKTADEYISVFPVSTQKLLRELRSTIKQVAPGAEEVISYNMPAFKQNGVLVYYAAYEKHIGFYPTASPIRVFKKELVDYKTSKGGIQFPVNKPIPKTVVKNIVKFRLKENAEKASMRTKK
jgi:uncharacterized protein YdhG (YjbR/CyaY superfamily)